MLINIFELYLILKLRRKLTFDQFWQISRIFRFYCDTYDGRYREFHNFHIVRILKRRDGTSLDQELINTDKTTNIAYIIK